MSFNFTNSWALTQVNVLRLVSNKTPISRPSATYKNNVYIHIVDIIGKKAVMPQNEFHVDPYPF